jgi:hypothetical protein
MTDLCDELIRCRGGEDSCITIERHREWRCNIEGRNLERDFESLERLWHMSWGCMALAPHLRMVVWLRKFWAHLPEKYDGMVNPVEFL